MSGVNKTIIVGRLGSEVETKALDSGKTVATMSVATSDEWKDKDGQKQERVEWHRIKIWGPQGENCAKYLKKGSQVYVEGSLRTSSYEKDGVKKYSTEIIANTVQFLDSKSSGSNSQSTGPEPSFDSNEEIPF